MAFVQGAQTPAGHTNTIPLAFPGNVGSGHLLVIVWRRTHSTTHSTVSDTLASPWTIVYEVQDSTGIVDIGWAYGFAPSSGTDTITVTTGTSGGIACIAEYSNVSAVRHVSSATISSSGNPITSPSVASSVGDFVLGLAGSDFGSLVISAGTGFLLREASSGGGGSSYCAIEDGIASGISTSASFKFSSSASAVVGVGAFIPISVNAGVSNYFLAVGEGQPLHSLNL